MNPALQAALTPADVAAANELTRRWLLTRDEIPSAASGFGVWPLLAMLAVGAVDETRAELLAALGLDATRAAALPRALLDGARTAPALSLAIGVWAGPRTVLDPDWVAALPFAAIGSLTGDAAVDKAALDAWACANTDGLIERMPIDLDVPEPISLLLASALSVRTRWRTPFTAAMPFATGPWTGASTLTAHYAEDVLRVGANASVLTVRGEDDIDVLLAIGHEDLDPCGVMSRLITAANRPDWGRPSSELDAGQRSVGVRVTEYLGEAPQTGPEVRATTVAFDIAADLDLTADAAPLGLELASDADLAQLDRLAADALYVSQAKQTCTARFTETGFEAAAVTAIGMSPMGSAPPPATHRHVRAEVTFDRPFAYLARHHPTGLILVAGWVSAPV